MSTSEKLNGKHFFVTGGSAGVGLAVCKTLRARRARVSSLSRRIARESTRDDAWQSIACDVADLQALSAQLKTLPQQLGELHGAIFCHGVGDFGGIEEFSESRITRLVHVNFLSIAWITRALMPMLRKQTRADLIFIGSEAALHGGKMGAVYSASKFALRGFAQSLRRECQTAGLRVALINPGMIDTAFFDELSFAPGEDQDNAIGADDVAAAVLHILAAPPNVVHDEINLSPLKKVVRRKDAK